MDGRMGVKSFMKDHSTIHKSTIHIDHTVSPLRCRLSDQVSTSSPPPDKLHRDFV